MCGIISQQAEIERKLDKPFEECIIITWIIRWWIASDMHLLFFFECKMNILNKFKENTKICLTRPVKRMMNNITEADFILKIKFILNVSFSFREIWTNGVWELRHLVFKRKIHFGLTSKHVFHVFCTKISQYLLIKMLEQCVDVKCYIIKLKST